MLATVHVAAQLDTNLTVICAGCPFSQMLLEWDMDPGADQLVQLGDSLYFRSNDGMGGFGAPQLVTTLPAGEQFVLFEDADGDGDWDLFSQADSTMHLLRNDGPTFTPVLLDSALELTNGPYHPAEFGVVRAMQVDDDGLKDLALRWNNGNTFIWYRNDGVGGYQKRIESLPVDLTYDAEVVAMDWDNDGANDLITTIDSEVHGVVIRGMNGSWSSPPDTICTATSSYGLRHWDVADLNLDGVQDLLNPQHMFLSDPDSVHHLRYQPVDLNYNNYRRIMDLDCDDRPELIGNALNVGNAVFTILQMEGDSLVFQQIEEFDPFIISYMLHVVADLNADGAPDLLFKELPQPGATFYAHYNLAVVPEVGLTLPFLTLPYGMNEALSGGTPIGGTWSGEGVVGDSLFTALTPGGPITVTYTYTTPYGCTDSAQAVVDIVTGLGPPVSKDALRLFPNPASVRVQVIVNEQGPWRHELLDACGRVVQRGEGTVFDVSTLPPGTYQVRLSSSLGVRSLPLIVAR
ncbi:MAG: T9SS type A sorting domain-containing protein [Flavobacteriales bacterium]|nr:T9SS type A sorting domain-containing protein [Flavobacteriales bacterium]MCB0787035.1 T9SS type A sorting domain-containing protein [Flavobacteriales bacterium]MCB0815613.1 T9SS type A sorting domain-containing protein [Flavobacteriales bacterium]